MSFIFEECLFPGCDVIVDSYCISCFFCVLLQYFNFNLRILSLNSIAKELREKNEDICHSTLGMTYINIAKQMNGSRFSTNFKCALNHSFVTITSVIRTCIKRTHAVISTFKHIHFSSS